MSINEAKTALLSELKHHPLVLGAMIKEDKGIEYICLYIAREIRSISEYMPSSYEGYKVETEIQHRISYFMKLKNK